MNLRKPNPKKIVFPIKKNIYLPKQPQIFLIKNFFNFIFKFHFWRKYHFSQLGFSQNNKWIVSTKKNKKNESCITNLLNLLKRSPTLGVPSKFTIVNAKNTKKPIKCLQKRKKGNHTSKIRTQFHIQNMKNEKFEGSNKIILRPYIKGLIVPLKQAQEGLFQRPFCPVILQYVLIVFHVLWQIRIRDEMVFHLLLLLLCLCGILCVEIHGHLPSSLPVWNATFACAHCPCKQTGPRWEETVGKWIWEDFEERKQELGSLPFSLEIVSLNGLWDWVRCYGSVSLVI